MIKLICVGAMCLLSLFGLPAFAQDERADADLQTAETAEDVSEAAPISDTAAQPEEMVDIQSLEASAENGSAEDQFKIALMYAKGEGVAQDYASALKWYTLAAEQGFAIAQYNLGFMYYNGEGVAQDYAIAVKWYTRAADQGDADAQYNLGVLYYMGEGVAQDVVTAVEWFELAAEQGHADAQAALNYIH